MLLDDILLLIARWSDHAVFEVTDCKMKKYWPLKDKYQIASANLSKCVFTFRLKDLMLYENREHTRLDTLW